MKSITIRDLRQRWPEAEKALEVEHEILITRDSKPVAKLVRVTPESTQQKRWDPQEHLRWLKKTWGNKMFPSADAAFERSRNDRWEQG